ncbi:Protein Kinase, partial [Phytophthora palmivora]
MYIGRTPFKDDNKAIMYRNIAEGFLYIPPELPEDVQSLLAGLIERDPSKRLGANEAVPFSIMKHPFFDGVDWEALQQKKVQPEWVPDVIDDADAKYVDNEFINQVPVDTPEWRMLDSVDREREYFEDFTYRATRVIQNPSYGFISQNPMFGTSENDAQERLLRAPLNPQQAAMSNAGNPGGIRQQEIGNMSGFTSLSNLMKMMEAATLMRYLRYANVVLAVLQALAGFLGLFNLVVLDITAVCGVTILRTFHRFRYCRFKHMEPWIRQQFGFLFTYRGRTAFIFIVGFMDFGMEGSLPYFVGFLMCGNAILSL